MAMCLSGPYRGAQVMLVRIRDAGPENGVVGWIQRSVGVSLNETLPCAGGTDKKKFTVHAWRREEADGAYSLVSDEAADGDSSPAHAAHEAAGHEATRE